MSTHNNKKSLNHAEVTSLTEAVLELNNPDEAKKFFRDLLTESEMEEFGKRWKVARMLYQKIPYSQIEKTTGMSSTTIARISRWLNKGTGGYKLMLERVMKKEEA
jgi:TrpR-related protein YerC/YecD